MHFRNEAVFHKYTAGSLGTPRRQIPTYVRDQGARGEPPEGCLYPQGGGGGGGEGEGEGAARVWCGAAESREAAGGASSSFTG